MEDKILEGEIFWTIYIDLLKALNTFFLVTSPNKKLERTIILSSFLDFGFMFLNSPPTFGDMCFFAIRTLDVLVSWIGLLWETMDFPSPLSENIGATNPTPSTANIPFFTGTSSWRYSHRPRQNRKTNGLESEHSPLEEEIPFGNPTQTWGSCRSFSGL